MVATTVEQLSLQYDADVTRINKKLDAIVNQNRAVIGKVERQWKDAARAFDPFNHAAQIAFAAITGYAVKAAADAAETQNAFEVAFGSGAKAAEDYAKRAADAVGRSSIDIKGAMSTVQLVLTGMGVDGKKALAITEQLASRAIDIGSLWNVSDAEAFSAVISGLTGETEPLKRFGAVVNETAVKAELLRLGFKGNAEKASEAAKAIARANLILEKTSSAAGDAARTADSTANSFKRAQSEFKDAAIALGTQLLPMVTKATHDVADLTREFNHMPAGLQVAGLALLGFVAAAGPIGKLIEGLVKVIKLAGAARAALIALPATGGVAVAGAAAAVTGGAALVTVPLFIPKHGVDAYQRAMKDPSKASYADLENALKYAAMRLNQLRENGVEPAERGAVDRLVAGVDQLASEVRSRGASGAAARANAPVLPAFDLSSLGLADPQGGTPGRTGAGASAGPTRGAGYVDENGVWHFGVMPESTRRALARRTVNIDYRPPEPSANPYDNPITRGPSDIGDRLDEVTKLNEGLTDQINLFPELTAAQQKWHDEFADNIADIVAAWATGTGDMGDMLKAMLRQMAADIIRAGVKDLISNILHPGQGGSGGFWSAAASSASAIFSGHAAGSGGSPGGWRMVGERGPELMKVPTGAKVIPNHLLQAPDLGASGARGGGATQIININAPGGLSDQHAMAIGALAAELGKQAAIGRIAQQRRNTFGTRR